MGLAVRDRFFDATHPPLGSVSRSLHLDMVISPNRLEIGVEVGIKGRIGRDLDARSLSFFSLAVHKLAFENLAHSILVKDMPTAPDLYSSLFEPVRQWARRGSPMRPVRPILWMSKQQVSTEFGSQIWRFGEDFAVDLALFDQRYAVSLTSSPADAKSDLLGWTPKVGPPRLRISDVMEGVGSSEPSPA